MWKRSRLRFYLLNVWWNYKFWLHAEKIYKNHSYEIDDGFDLENVDITGKIISSKRRINKKRFVGYMYKNKLYLDNPGLREFVDKETWNAWIKKGIVK